MPDSHTRSAFREDATTQAAGLLLSLGGGRMRYMQLFTLLYLADREALLRWRSPITFDAYLAMDRGPLLAGAFQLIIAGPRPGGSAFWHDHIATEGLDVRLRQPCGDDHLSAEEQALLRRTFERFGRRPRWELVQHVRALPEWTAARALATPITHRDILTGPRASRAGMAG